MTSTTKTNLINNIDLGYVSGDKKWFSLAPEGNPSPTLDGIDIHAAQDLSGHRIIDADGNDEVSIGDWIVDPNTGTATEQFDPSYFNAKDPAKLEAFLSKGIKDVHLLIGQDKTLMVTSLKNTAKAHSDPSRYIYDASVPSITAAISEGYTDIAPSVLKISEIGVGGTDIVHWHSDTVVYSDIKLNEINQNIVGDNVATEPEQGARLVEWRELKTARDRAVSAGATFETAIKNGELGFTATQALLDSLKIYNDAQSKVPFYISPYEYYPQTVSHSYTRTFSLEPLPPLDNGKTDDFSDMYYPEMAVSHGDFTRELDELYLEEPKINKNKK